MFLGFATDPHGRINLYDWLINGLRNYDMIAIGGDIDDYSMNIRLQDISSTDNLFMVIGNHDYPSAPIWHKDSKILHGTTAQIQNYTIGGLCGSLPAGRWPMEVSESEYEILCKKMGKVDILITHNPPYNTKCDIVDAEGFGADEFGHVGSKSIRDYIEKKQPRLVLTGHIHESQGIDYIGKSMIVNPGAFYNGHYAEIEFGRKKIDVEFKSYRTRV